MSATSRSAETKPQATARRRRGAAFATPRMLGVEEMIEERSAALIAGLTPDGARSRGRTEVDRRPPCRSSRLGSSDFCKRRATSELNEQHERDLGFGRLTLLRRAEGLDSIGVEPSTAAIPKRVSDTTNVPALRFASARPRRELGELVAVADELRDLQVRGCRALASALLVYQGAEPSSLVFSEKRARGRRVVS